MTNKTMSSKIFVNLPVRDLEKSKLFYQALGFSINPQFTDENAACVVISEDIYAMILTHDFLKRFTKKEIVDATKATEAIMALSTDSREDVDEFAKKAVAAGGKISRDPEDHGWMYSQAIEDLDGHIWERVWMDEKSVPAHPQA